MSSFPICWLVFSFSVGSCYTIITFCWCCRRVPPFGALAIYINVGLLFASAVGMSFNQGRRLAAVFHGIHLLLIAAVVYFSDALHYRKPVLMRMAVRMVGVSGCFFTYGYFMSSKPRPKMLRRFGEILIGLYALATTYCVLQIAEDREAFLKMFPFSQPLLFVYATLLGGVGLCFLPGLFIYDTTILLTILLALSTAFVDCRMHYWTKRRGLDYWNQFRLAADSFSLVCGCLLYLCLARKKLPKDSEAADKQD